MRKISYQKFLKQVAEYLGESSSSPTNVKIKDFMSPDVKVLRADSKLKDAIEAILEKRIEAVPVADDQNVVIGAVTKRLALKAIYKGIDINAPVKDVMITDPVTTGPDVDILGLLNVPIASLPVIEDSHVVGVLSPPDTVRACFSAVYMLQGELKTVIHSAHSGIIRVDIHGNIGLINAAAEQALGMSRQDLVGQPIPNAFLDRSTREVINSGRDVAAARFSCHNRVLVATISQLKHDDRVIGAVIVFQDISELESISQELSETKQLKDELNTIVASSFDGIFLTDRLGKILRANDAFARILGTSKEELIGQTVRELCDRGIFKQPMPMHNMLEGKAVTFNQEVRGEKVVVVTSNPILDVSGNLCGIVHNVRDTSEVDCLRMELEKAEEVGQHFKEQLKAAQMTDKYIAKSRQSRDLIRLVMKLSRTDVTVLILGESGVGKQVVANMLHESSARKDKSMITINCAAIPEGLLESELFGYEYGAFTGANKRGKPGAFELADGGTLFLDEVGELQLGLQAKLLRVLQEREIPKLGAGTPKAVDVRILSATNRNLWEMVQNKTFREDLFYRLNIVPVWIAPLRERKEEIPELVFHFTQVFNRKYSVNKSFDEGAIQQFLEHDWPGNVRELENTVERSIVISPEAIIREVSIPQVNASGSQEAIGMSSFEANYKRVIMDTEKDLIEKALKRFGSTRKAAESLGISQSTVCRRAKKYNLAGSGIHCEGSSI